MVYITTTISIITTTITTTIRFLLGLIQLHEMKWD